MADHDPVIAEALEKLAVEHADAAADAEAALEWLTAGEGLSALTQERLQYFLWYALPMKWMTDTDHHRQVAAALGRALDLLGLPRYAAVCRSATTTEVLDAYERSDAEGKRAFHRADTASGIRPPDTDDLAWGAYMGVHESAALSSTAELLELAIAVGDLVPGASGWKQRQQHLINAHLHAARLELDGQTLLDSIRNERIEWWLERHRSPTRRLVLEPLVEPVRNPPGLPNDITDPIPPLAWLLGELNGGQPLTQTGNLSRAFVQDAAHRFGWWDMGLRSLPRSEDELYDLHQVRSLAQNVGLARRSGRKLVLTRTGQAAVNDVQLLWSTAAGGLLPARDFFAAALGEITLGLLATGEATSTQLQSILTHVVHEVGWRAVDTGAPPNEHDISRTWHRTTNLLRALNLLSTGGHWTDDTYSLTAIGHAMAFEALHQRATGPRFRLGE